MNITNKTLSLSFLLVSCGHALLLFIQFDVTRLALVFACLLISFLYWKEYVREQVVTKIIEKYWWNLSPNYTDKEYYCSIEVNRVLELLLEEVKKIK